MNGKLAKQIRRIAASYAKENKLERVSYDTIKRKVQTTARGKHAYRDRKTGDLLIKGSDKPVFVIKYQRVLGNCERRISQWLKRNYKRSKANV